MCFGSIYTLNIYLWSQHISIESIVNVQNINYDHRLSSPVHVKNEDKKTMSVLERNIPIKRKSLFCVAGFQHSHIQEEETSKWLHILFVYNMK